MTLLDLDQEYGALTRQEIRCASKDGILVTLDVTLDEVHALGVTKDVVKPARGYRYSSDGTIGPLLERCQPSACPAGRRDVKHCLAVAIRQREGMHLGVPATRR
jgi:hypothetical protein